MLTHLRVARLPTAIDADRIFAILAITFQLGRLPSTVSRMPMWQARPRAWRTPGGNSRAPAGNSHGTSPRRGERFSDGRPARPAARCPPVRTGSPVARPGLQVARFSRRLPRSLHGEARKSHGVEMAWEALVIARYFP
jgi:hypothetical protein